MSRESLIRIYEIWRKIFIGSSTFLDITLPQAIALKVAQIKSLNPTMPVQCSPTELTAKLGASRQCSVSFQAGQRRRVIQISLKQATKALRNLFTSE